VATALLDVRLFVLDDADVIQILVARIAADLGHSVAGKAATLGEGVAALKTCSVDVVVVDSRLPGVSDISAAIGALRAAAPDAALVTLAALDERELVRRARDAGAAGALLRPLSRSGFAASFAALVA